ncbi:MAG TPA: 3-oxoacyl-[acyl-carrier-protein] reductase [Rubricoccaceae bacterium]|nr:3-oxoacyl-[acyl-carrier-protein] reductase [Rubricoccaceae bacterium]
MHLDLTGKNALVTGGTRGIGRAIVDALAAAGANVAFTYRSSAEAADALKRDLEGRGTRCLAFQGDAADVAHAQEAVSAVVDAWGSLDVLVNNAGVTRDTLLLRMSEEDWDAVLDTNLKGVFAFCKAAYRPMMKQRSGSIVNISSIAGVEGNPGQTNYAASKAGIIGFTKSLAKELGSRNVRANVVAPGVIETEMSDEMEEKMLQLNLQMTPMARFGRPEEVAAAVVFLASDASSYVTGHTLHVDGGRTM